jgi:glycoprotein endo-alpha-1,2-mannosidase
VYGLESHFTRLSLRPLSLTRVKEGAWCTPATVRSSEPEILPLNALRLTAVVAALLVFVLPAAARAAPRVSIFYYPWYGTPARDGEWEHWLRPDGAGADIASTYYPARGLYSSSNDAIVRAQMHEIAATGVEEIVSSWWGWGSAEDVRLPLVIREAHAAGLAVAVHLEPYLGRTAETVKNDIDHLRTMGITRFFVYRPFDIRIADWVGLRAAEPGIQLFAQTSLPGKAAAAKFDGMYTYDILLWGADTFPRLCAQAHRVSLVCMPSVGPGYDATHATDDLRVKSRRDGKTYDSMWSSALRSSADGVTITSYNEWHEGTQIEPARTHSGGSAASATFESYDGAYGLSGRASENAYLDRTTYWAETFLRSRRVSPWQHVTS